MQNPSKPIGSSLFFKSLCGMGTGRDLKGATECNVPHAAESRVQQCPEKVAAAQGDLSSPGVACHRRRQSLGTSAPRSKSLSRGEAQAGNGKWGSGPFIWVPVSNVQEYDSRLGLRSGIRTWGSQRQSFVDRAQAPLGIRDQRTAHELWEQVSFKPTPGM